MSSLERWFRGSEYLTLGLSCSALVFAESPFLPELQICLAPVLALLLMGWWVEGRWSLPNRGADLLGLVIVAGGVFWAMTHLHEKDFVLAQLPWHLALLPFMGPLLIAALLVKVFRTRDPSHFWHVQGMALTQIGLGCMLDGGPAFGVAMAAYLASALACLALRYRLSISPVRREERAIFSPHSSLLTPHSSRAGKWLLAFTPRWALLIAAPALVLFFLTPRRDKGAWEPLNNFSTGYHRIRVQGGSEELNLNDTGRLELNDETAFEVSAVDADGRPKMDLPVEQRWRSIVLNWYERGAWTLAPLGPSNRMPVQQRALPDFGREQFFLTFSVHPRRAGGLMLAEPISFGPPFARLPVLSLEDDGRQRLFAEQAGTLMPVEISEKRRHYHYRQVVPGRSDSSRTPAVGLRPSQAVGVLTKLPDQLKTELQGWTGDLLLRLSQEPRYRLPDTVRATLKSLPHSLQVTPVEWEATALLLADYLAHSGEYTYSLEITRHDRTIDPVLDFLVNVKKGHCERYAAALASILRSVEIPARIVRGYRGWSSLGEGRYEVKQRHAHAWVEILVPRPGPVPRFGFASRLGLGIGPEYAWLELDPTPPAVVSARPELTLSQVWQSVQQFFTQAWRFLIIEYNGEEQADLWDALTSGPSLPRLRKGGLLALVFAAIAGLGLSLRRLSYRHRRRRANPHGGPDAALYPRLLRILVRYTSLRPRPGQTPREYGETARDFLQTQPAVAALAELPPRVIDLFYRTRFGGRPLGEEERQTLDSDLDRFAAVLRRFSRRGSDLPSG